MTIHHALSTAVHDLERQNEVMREVIDLAFVQGRLTPTLIKKLAPVLEHAVDGVLTTRGLGVKLVKAYQRYVKSPADPDGGGKDTSTTQAVKNAETLLTAGWKYDTLHRCILEYGRQSDGSNVKWEHRFNAGNFFGRRAEFKHWLPADSMVDPVKAKKVQTLFE